ncbi:Lrp/AsnC family transcriptional regulator [Kribbella sp. CA-294648]|uniref:Lrp/AsnC family transcriptional regulator n=1 Tax=Kribbella sp. CA-294648 TaxID=3239948 RepID=UPI003D90F848
MRDRWVPPESAEDEHLLAVLGRDGRASLAELADATGWSAATVARRLSELQASGAIYFDVDLDPTLFGATTGHRPTSTKSVLRSPSTTNSLS